MRSVLKRASIAIVVPAVLAVGLASSALAGGGGSDKVTICHLASHKYVKITISENALNAHLGHGDVMPDDYGDCP